nr:HEAT repeat domain-containing protein [Deinococcota bacterium]
VAASLNQPISIRFVFSAYTITDPLKNTALSRQTEWGTVYRESSSAIISDDFNRETLERLAIENPAHLLEIVNNASLTPPLLTYAAEYLGNIKNKDEGLAERIVESLLRLTENMSALVREGAIYGLEDYLDRPDVAERLTQIIASDSSPGVKAAAQEALEE